MAMLSAITETLKRICDGSAIPDFGSAIATKKIAARPTAVHPNERLNARKGRIDAAVATRKIPITPLLILAQSFRCPLGPLRPAGRSRGRPGSRQRDEPAHALLVATGDHASREAASL